MRWKTSIINPITAILVLCSMLVVLIECIIDKCFTNISMKLITAAILAVFVAFIIAVNIRVTTDDQGIDYKFLWIRESIKWDAIDDYRIILGNLWPVTLDDHVCSGIPIIWLKDRKSFLCLLDDKLRCKN